MLGLRQHGIEADAVGHLAGVAAVLGQREIRAIVVGPGLRHDPAVVLGRAQADTVAVVVDAKAGWDAMSAGAADFVLVSGGVDALALALRKVDARAAFARAREARGGSRPAPRPDRVAVDGAGSDGAPAVVPALLPALLPERGPVPAASAERAPALARFVGEDPGIVALLAKVRRFAPVASPVLIGGESGTGKELVARALHELSPWRAGAFVPVNCGAIPAGLIESELFGHERGSFTDAVRDKQGLFEVADGGTLFLDEIADLPLGLQAKMLRVLQDGMVRRVGSTADVRVHVRVLAASARDLAGEVRAGRFREDFYYRLATLDLQIPPLRARREDIPRLAEHFLAQGCARLGLPPRTIDPEAMRILVAYPWPGNARELENTLERAAVLCAEDRVDVSSLPEKVVRAVDVGGYPDLRSDVASLATLGTRGESDLSIKHAMLEIEANLIRRALAKTRGNRVRAAELLEISHRALLYKIKDYAIEVDSAKRGAGSKAKNDGEPLPGASRARPLG